MQPTSRVTRPTDLTDVRLCRAHTGPASILEHQASIVTPVFLTKHHACCADPIRGLPASWSTKIRTGGLATILMRAGLKIDKNAFKRAGRVVLSLALVPVICEAIVDGFCFYW